MIFNEVFKRLDDAVFWQGPTCRIGVVLPPHRGSRASASGAAFMVSVIAAKPIAQMMLAAMNSEEGLNRDAVDDCVEDGVESRPRSAERKICEIAMATHTIVSAMKKMRGALAEYA